MDKKPPAVKRRIIGFGLMILGAVLAYRILPLCLRNWPEYFEETRNRMVLWFGFSLATIFGGLGVAFRNRAAYRLAILTAVLAIIALATYHHWLP